MSRSYSARGSRLALASTLCLASLLGAGCEEPTRGGGTGVPAGLHVLFKVPVERADNAFVPASDGQRLYADVNRRIKAFDLGTGAKLWSYQRPVGGPSSLVARDGRVFWAGDTAVALDAATGRELWRYVLDSTAGLGRATAMRRHTTWGRATIVSTRYGLSTANCSGSVISDPTGRTAGSCGG